LECFDILNELGQKTGEVKSRAQVHRDGDWHRTIHLWVLNGCGELLLQHRGPKQESNPNKWDISCAGHVLEGESSMQAAERELSEEIGWKLKSFNPVFLGELKSDRKDGGFWDREWSDIYLLKAPDPVPSISIQIEELQGVTWMRWVELREILEKDVQGESEWDFVEHDEEYAMLFSYLQSHL
jgi:isopentenyldiphosphate isomerase